MAEINAHECARSDCGGGEVAATAMARSTERAPAPPDHQKHSHREDQQVILEALAFLSARPIHEESEGAMHGHNRNDHVYADSERCDSGEESQDEPESTEELRHDRQEGERSRDVQHAGKEAHGGGKPVASEPAQHLLRAVREKDNSQHQSQNRRCGVVISGI